jgi:polygalacturonase
MGTPETDPGQIRPASIRHAAMRVVILSERKSPQTVMLHIRFAQLSLRLPVFQSMQTNNLPLPSRSRRFVPPVFAPVLATIVALSSLAGALGAAADSTPVGWDAVPGILARIKAPQFPARDFPITDYGAKGDGTTDCTEAINQAIAACNAAGGGRVVVSGGVFFTGPVHLKSNVNLHIAEGATLKFTADKAKFPIVLARYEGVEVMNYSPLIYALDQENIAVTGKGTLDGSASNAEGNWWGRGGFAGRGRGGPGGPGGAGGGRGAGLGRGAAGGRGAAAAPSGPYTGPEQRRLRPNFWVPYRCKNVLIEDVTIINSPMWELNPVLCTNVTVRGVTIHCHGPNNDGCDPDSSKDVLIENCTFDTGDDCIAIKSGKDADGRRVNVPSENIIIRNCTMMDGHGGVVMGSENSGGVRNVFAENCKMDSPNLERALRLKTNSTRGGFHENVFFRNMEVGQVSDSILTIDLVYGGVQDGPFPPNVRNVLMENVTVKSAPRVLSIIGTPKSVIENVRIVNSKFCGIAGPDRLVNSGTVTYQNVTIEAAPPKPGEPPRPRSPNGN